MAACREDIAWVRRFRRALVREMSPLISVCQEEMDKPPFEVLMSDLVPLLDSCKWHERHAKRVLRPKRLRRGGLWRFGQRHTLRRDRLGHVAIIATWNYPYQLLGIQLVQAIAAGNRVTVKPSERSPQSQRLLLELARDAGLSDSRLTWTKPSREAGRLLLEYGQFDHVVFTGSTATGREIARTLAESLTPSTLELSGSDSALVLASADPLLAADSIFYALTLNSGQSCMTPRRVIVEDRVYERFIDAFRAKFDADAAVRKVHGAEAEQCRDLVEQARSIGVEIAGGHSAPAEGFAPTAVLSCPAEAAIAGTEYFGPAIAVHRSTSRHQTVDLAEGMMKSLATSIFCASTAEAMMLAEQLSAGFVTINDCILPTAHPGTSISGTGLSGWGSSRGELGLLAMTRPRFVSQTSKRVRIPVEHPTTSTQRRIERFVRWWYSR